MGTSSTPAARGVEVRGPSLSRSDEILTPAALDFVAGLTRRFSRRIEEALEQRAVRRSRYAAGDRPGFLSDTADVRAGDWRIAKPAPGLVQRIVEITGPVDRKMIINALNSGADVFMADFEDATSPTWDNLVQGQANLCDAVRRSITFEDPTTRKAYALARSIATLVVRPRGLHLPERHLVVDGRPVPGSLFDFGFYFFHNARELLTRGIGPYFYIPKLESHLEARLWNDVFLAAQEELGIPRGTIRATVLIETLPAAFEMDEILYELREHSAGLNCGRWDYIFSFIKTLREDPNAVFPDRSQVTMQQPCMRAYTQLAVRTCHRRGAHAMGGMAAQIPIRDNPAANELALEKVRADKAREARDGHDGTWVAHPALVPVAREAFGDRMTGPHQIERRLEIRDTTPAQLLKVPEGTRTEAGLRLNVRVGVQYIEAWLRGTGAVPLYNLMEDAATAEISRTQLWQWTHHAARLQDGRTVTAQLLEQVIAEEMGTIESEIGAERIRSGRFPEARALFTRLVTSPTLDEFLTTGAYEILEETDR